MLKCYRISVTFFMPEFHNKSPEGAEPQIQNKNGDNLDGVNYQQQSSENIHNAKIEEILAELNNYSDEDKNKIKGLLNDSLGESGSNMKGQFLNEIFDFIKGKGDKINFLKLSKLIEIKGNKYQTIYLKEREANETDNNIRKLLGLLEGSSNQKIRDEVLAKIDGFKRENINDREKLSELVLQELSNPELLQTVAEEFKNKGQYEDFKDIVISLDKGLGEKYNFSSKFDALEAKWKTQLGTTSIDNAKRTSSGWEQADGEFTTKVSNEGKRTFSIEGSKYEMDLGEVNQNRIKEIDEVNQKYNSDVQPLNEKLSSLSSVINFIKQAIADNDEIGEVKNYLKREVPEIYNNSELNLANAQSLDSMLNSLNYAFQQTKDEKEKLEKGSKDKIERIITQNAKEIQDKQELQKQVLKFFRDIGFDAIPQNVIKQVVDLLNANPSLKTKFGFNAGKIDFSNGSLGIERDADIFTINDEEKQLFIKFFNKMITGDSRYPLEYTGLTTQFYPTLEDFETKTFSTAIDRNKYIGDRLGSNQFLVIQKNLEKTEN